jgi:hypothetical protein
MQWWVDLLDHFDALEADRQAIVSEFTGVAMEELELMDKSLPPAPPEGTGKSIKLSGVFAVIGDDDVETTPAEDAAAEPEWQEIPAAKRPTGCCIIS